MSLSYHHLIFPYHSYLHNCLLNIRKQGRMLDAAARGPPRHPHALRFGSARIPSPFLLKPNDPTAIQAPRQGQLCQPTSDEWPIVALVQLSLQVLSFDSQKTNVVHQYLKQLGGEQDPRVKFCAENCSIFCSMCCFFFSIIWISNTCLNPLSGFCIQL